MIHSLPFCGSPNDLKVMNNFQGDLLKRLYLSIVWDGENLSGLTRWCCGYVVQ